jgi:ankyrin repeat protein
MARSRPESADNPLLDFLQDPAFREELDRRMKPVRNPSEGRQPSSPQMSIKSLMELDQDDGGRTRDANVTLFRLALERGTDPNHRSGANNQTMLHACANMPADTGRALAELFLEFGADPNMTAADGRTPYSAAVRMGNTAVCDLLLAHGGRSDSAGAADHFAGACRRADSAAAWSIVRSHPQILKAIGPEREDILIHAVTVERIHQARNSVDLHPDFPPNIVNP